ncbi:MAG: 16S rRNA (adenine(1518)-N(6)/adenine(1519)-N(6))-dimethyltransferase RsmA [Candidatus Bathyarchaeia archaeon]
MSLRREVAQAIRLGIKPRRRLGQSFVVDEGLLRRMVGYGRVKREDVVLEVGGGLGFLTRELAKAAGVVVSIEIDTNLTRSLRERVRGCKNVAVIRSDALSIPLVTTPKIVSNPPYQISSPLLFNLLETDFELAVLTLQMEFANRLVAQPGTRDYSRLTVSTSYKAQVEILEGVPKGSFYPQPEVDSAVVRIVPRDFHPRADDTDFFHDMVRAIFSHRNKKVRNAVRGFVRERTGIHDRRRVRMLADSVLYGEKRVRELSLEMLVKLSNDLKAVLNRTRNPKLHDR